PGALRMGSAIATFAAEESEVAMAQGPQGLLTKDALAAVTLDEQYMLDKSGVYLPGTQALVPLPQMQRQRDVAAGLNTGCFISGYRGSPPGALDSALCGARHFVR